jgi:hypothetical protein
MDMAASGTRYPRILHDRSNGKMDGAVVVAASIVAAIRMRGEPITQSPKVAATISDSIRLARMVLDGMERG